MLETEVYKQKLLLKYGSMHDYKGYFFSFETIGMTKENTFSIPIYDTSPITLRGRNEGDVISFGSFSKKLRRLFIDEKYSIQERNEAIIGLQNDIIIFVIVADKTYLRKMAENDIMRATLYIENLEKGDIMLEQDIKKILYTEEDIIIKTKELGEQLTKDYQGKNPLMVGVLKGSVPFMAELIKHIDTHVEIDFMVVSSYHGGTMSSGEVKILKDVDTNIEYRDIIFIEDIIDTGRTLKYLIDMFKYRKANSVKIATLFDKPESAL